MATGGQGSSVSVEQDSPKVNDTDENEGGSNTLHVSQATENENNPPCEEDKVSEINNSPINFNKGDSEGSWVIDKDEKRERVLTERGQAYREELALTRFKSELHTWRRHITKLQPMISDCKDADELRQARNDLEPKANAVIDSYIHVTEVKPDPSNVIDEKYEDFDKSNLQTLERLTEAIRIIEYDRANIFPHNSRANSHRSKRSSKSAHSSHVHSNKSEVSSRSHESITSKKAEAAAELAALQVKLKHCDVIAKQQLELERIKTKQQLEMASARVAAISQIEQEDKGSTSSVHIEHSLSNIAGNVVDPPNQQPDPKPLNPNVSEFALHSNVLQSQTDNNSLSIELAKVARSLADQVYLGRLPTPEPGVFSGDPLKFLSWISAFETLIESRGIPAAERIHFLKRYLGGDALASVQDCFLVPSDTAYVEAKTLLQHRYGDNFTIANAFRDRLENWPKMSGRDAANLRKYADFLRQCRAAMANNPSLLILNDERENRKMLSKLPDWLVTRWARQVANHREAYQTFPLFSDFVQFIVRESDIACDPITCLQSRSVGSERKGIATNKITTKTSDRQIVRSFKTSTGPENTCSLCEKDHHIDDCQQFLKKPLEERKKFARERHLCFGCLKPGHRSKACKIRLKCKTCSKAHPSALHGDLPLRSLLSSDEPAVSKPPQAVTRASYRSGSSKSSMIVPVWVTHDSQPDKDVLVYALLDNQSDTSFILEKTCTELGLTGVKTWLSLSTMSSENELISSTRISDLRVRAYNSTESVILHTLYTRDIMPANRSHIPTPEIADNWPHLKPVVPHLMPLHECDIGLLIGYDCPQAIFPTELIPPIGDGPFGQRTVLGWGIVGIVDHDNPDSDAIGPSHQTFHTTCASAVTFRTRVKEILNPQSISKILERDFSEHDTSSAMMSQQDFRFIEIMENSINRLNDGHYEMPLPFDKDQIFLPNNRVAASVRLQQLKKRFERNSDFREQYCKSIDTMLSNGYAELVPPNEEPAKDGTVWYLPHHGVYHPKKPGKLRVVFDGSATFRGHSLNGHLLQGPDLNNNLLGVMLRFRKENVAIICDIEAMFHQFRVHPSYRNYLRFLWWPEGQCDQIPSEYRMAVYMFGAASSPACANFALKKIATDFEAQYGQEASKFIQDNFYVDDGLTSVPSVEEGISLVKATQCLCAEGGLRLHKFASNSREVLKAIPKEERASEAQDIDLSIDILPPERALGVQWCTESDTLQFQATPGNRAINRRGILSTVSSIFDPLGLIAPVSLKGKLILQELCRQNLDWDDPVSEPLHKQYISWLEDLTLLKKFNIDRCYKPKGFGSLVKVELHNFSDASFDGYGQCSYLRLIDDNSNVHCSLVIGKARVSPLKSTTVPRLELTAAVVSARINTLLVKELQYDHIESFFWTDSKAVLSYISNEEKRFHIFVANRVREIRDRSNPSQWHYVPTDLNPADVASRGLSAENLIKSTWIRGPSFLWDHDIFLLTSHSLPYVIADNDPEVKKISVLVTESSISEQSILEHLKKISSWSKICRTIALCFTFCKKLKSLVSKDNAEHEINIQDIYKAGLIVAKLVQREAFADTFQQLERGKALKRDSALYKLDPFLKDGLLRIGGRIKNADVPFHVKHPIVLPKNHPISESIVRHYHEHIAHQGKNMTTNEVRANGYWIIGLGRVVARVVSKCIICRKLRGNLQDQKMADLPQDRLQPGPPFTHCGVDYFGPWHVKEGRKELKRYGVLFTCLTSRAIHIETANSLDSSSFINALRRFISIRGPIRTLRSDRGTNFVGAEHELKRAAQDMDHEEIKQFLLKHDCDFVFNPPSASHMGGVWERQIRSVRNVLASLLNNLGHQLDDEMLRTVMCEAAAIVNCRPLAVDSLNDPTSITPISPNNLLTMKSGVVLPPPGRFEKADIYCHRRWRRVQYLMNEFWHRWKREYLQTLQKRQKWTNPKRSLQIGDIVIIKDDETPRSHWRLARVIEAAPSQDGHVRKVRLIVGDSSIDNKGCRIHPVTYLERPIHKLVLLLENES